MAEDWPSPHHHEPHPLPRLEDLPSAWEGYDRERVQGAFDAFYRHIAQLDATLRALESVDVFQRQAGDLRTELRSLRAAGWAPAPRGYALTPERSMFGSVPEAVTRIALEVIFLVVVAAVVAVAEFSALEIVAVMAGAVLITFLVELIAARERRGTTPIPAAAPAARLAPATHVDVVQPGPEHVAAEQEPAPAVAENVQTPTDELVPEEEDEPARADDDVGGWAAFAEPMGQQPLALMGALAAEEELPAPEPAPPPEAAVPEPEPEPPRPETEPESEPDPEEPEPEPETEPELEPVGELEPGAEVSEADTGTIARHRRFRRRKPEPRPREPAPAPKHVRVLPPPETALAEAELPPWERGFDDTEERR